ncbi:alpha/beta hydrolase fold domain-containing protein [Embleya sp. NBC_00888]|uniref:alpha/beta hydrolase fold domain-containing protein n=1 Tax=Embleya sp. NBC_00888 TaxID=2975960 RepID=UPI00386E7308
MPSPRTATTRTGNSTAKPISRNARAHDLSGLPPTYVATAELDPVRDDGIGYAMRLSEAGVSVELRQWAGTFHGSQTILTADVSQRRIAEITAVSRRAMAAQRGGGTGLGADSGASRAGGAGGSRGRPADAEPRRRRLRA